MKDIKTNPNINIDLKKEVPFIEFPILKSIPFINHGFSTRLGGVSKGIFKSMNLSLVSAGNEDNHDNIITNYKRITSSMGIDYNSLVLSHQLHNTNIRKVTINDLGKGIYKDRDYQDVDGLITNISGITLVTIYADCVPIYLVDEKNKAIGLVHSGWKGTVNKISACAIEQMNTEYGTEAKNIKAVIGPSICKDCYEISEDVAEQFKKSFHKDRFNFRILEEKSGNKYLCDLWSANKYVLLESGVKEENISISNLCTCCNDDLLHSHRKTKGERGSLAAFLTIN